MTQDLYNKWAIKNNFVSKLPKAVKASKEAAQAANRTKQSAIDPHLHEKPQVEWTVPYTDTLFRDAAIEWLIAMDHVSHSSFYMLLRW